MSPLKALELVQRYAETNRKIKALKKQIGERLDHCKGVNGDRLNVDSHGWLTYRPELDEKNRDKGLHLWRWYQPETVDDGNMNPTIEWEHITATIHGAECQHCYAAHLAIQERKAARKTFAGIKAAMSKATGEKA